MSPSYLDYVIERFNHHGWRVSAGVRNIATILQNSDTFLSQASIEDQLQDDGKPLDYTTIYRILRRLESLGLAHEWENQWHREHEPENPLHGHFLICEDTGKVEEIYLDYFEAISKQLSREKGFLLREVRMAFFGKSDPKRR